MKCFKMDCSVLKWLCLLLIDYSLLVLILALENRLSYKEEQLEIESEGENQLHPTHNYSKNDIIIMIVTSSW
jgi:uncharacterized protein YpmS